MKTLTWPLWLPRPTAWVRGYVVTSIFAYLFVSALLEVARTARSSREFTSGFIFAVVVSWFMLLPIMAYLHHWLILLLHRIMPLLPETLPGHERLIVIGKSVEGKKWQWPGLRSWREGMNAAIVLPLATVAWGIVLIPLGSLALLSLPRAFVLQRLLSHYWVVWVILAAYLYNYDILARERRAAKNQPKSQPVTQSADPVEQELQRIKFQQRPLEEGMAKVKPPGETQWYVFRNGQEVGPFTKEELKVYRVTARTNVKRSGESEWTRAGQISELKDILNEA